MRTAKENNKIKNNSQMARQGKTEKPGYKTKPVDEFLSPGFIKEKLTEKQIKEIFSSPFFKDVPTKRLKNLILFCLGNERVFFFELKQFLYGETLHKLNTLYDPKGKSYFDKIIKNKLTKKEREWCFLSLKIFTDYLYGFSFRQQHADDDKSKVKEEYIKLYGRNEFKNLINTIENEERIFEERVSEIIGEVAPKMPKTVPKKAQPATEEPPHPGPYLREHFFDPRNLSMAEGAVLMNLPHTTLSKLFNKISPFTPRIAAKFEKFFKQDMTFPLMMQVKYDLHKARSEEDETPREYKVSRKRGRRPKKRHSNTLD